MNITILCVGTLKESWWRDAAAEYAKRLSPYCRIEIHEVREERLEQNASPARIAQAMAAEAERLSAKLPKRACVVGLCIEGKQKDSVEFSEAVERWAIEGDGHVVFVIGGSDGIDEALKRRFDARLSFSRMTFPHQLMRVVLLEQIYRAFRIRNNEPYHK